MRVIQNRGSFGLLDTKGQLVINKEGKQVCISHREFILDRLGDSQFGKGMKEVLSASRISAAIDDDSASYWFLEEADWERLQYAVVNPSMPYNTNVAQSLIPFMKAVTEAEERKVAYNVKPDPQDTEAPADEYGLIVPLDSQA